MKTKEKRTKTTAKQKQNRRQKQISKKNSIKYVNIKVMQIFF